MTCCLNCGLTLTTADGKRLHGAHFDSILPSFPQGLTFDGLDIVWARCNPCYHTAIRNQ